MTDIFGPDVFDTSTHEDPFKHLIGVSLPPPDQVAPLTVGGAANIGTSQFPARADHTHDIGTNIVAPSGLTLGGRRVYLPVGWDQQVGTVVALNNTGDQFVFPTASITVNAGDILDVTAIFDFSCGTAGTGIATGRIQFLTGPLAGIQLVQALMSLSVNGMRITTMCRIAVTCPTSGTQTLSGIARITAAGTGTCQTSALGRLITQVYAGS